MNLPRDSSYPGYIPSLPVEPPGIHYSPVEIKGEYIEDCDDIKEEDSRPASAIPPEFLTRPYPGFPSAPALSQLPQLPQLPGPGQPPSLAPGLPSPNLTPFQLIQKLSSYASNNRKRAPPPHIPPPETAPQSPPKKKNLVSSPRIEQVMSLQSAQSQVSQSKEANNNSPVSPPAPHKSMIDCPVCGDIAVAHFHYGGMCCYSCKAFFRRVVNTNKVS